MPRREMLASLAQIGHRHSHASGVPGMAEKDCRMIDHKGYSLAGYNQMFRRVSTHMDDADLT